jgi:signal transduction histidine kinase
LEKANQELNESYQQLRETQNQLIQADKLTMISQMTAAFIHDIGNPVSAALVFTKLLTEQITNNKFSRETALDYLSHMNSALNRSSRLIKNLMSFTRQSPPSLKLVNINDVIDRTLYLTARPAKEQNVDVIKELDSSLPKAMADADQLEQVFTNLVLNAIQAMVEGGRLIIRTSTDENQVRIEFEDTGCGISPENMSKLFTPFFTTKAKGHGVGLGLAVSYVIIQQHSGTIEVQSEVGKGTMFTVCVPMEQERKVNIPDEKEELKTIAIT